MRFDPPENADTAQKVEELIAGGHFFCVDWKKQPLNLHGFWRSGGNYANFDVRFTACASIAEDNEDCVWDKQ